MYSFSIDFLAGCQIYARLAQETDKAQEIRVFNTSCITCAASYLEAKLNEDIAIARLCFDDDSKEGKGWRVIQEVQRKLSVQEKWNLIAAQLEGQVWDGGKEPFQSFDTIHSLRNELIHYKGELLGRDEAPSNRIKSLMVRFAASSQASWIESDCSSWVTDLLSKSKLAEWICERTRDLDSQYHGLLHKLT